MILAALALAVVIAAAAAGIAMTRGGGDGDGGGGGASTDGVCERQTFESQGRDHVQELEEGFEYNSTPATSGPHHPTPAIWDAYDEPVDELNLVHNLEHGGIVVQYGEGIEQETVDQIVAWYREDPNGMIVAPRPELGDEIALTAWRQLATCSRFDEEAFSSFRDDYRYKGPENFPPEFLVPGS